MFFLKIALLKVAVLVKKTSLTPRLYKSSKIDHPCHVLNGFICGAITLESPFRSTDLYAYSDDKAIILIIVAKYLF